MRLVCCYGLLSLALPHIIVFILINGGAGASNLLQSGIAAADNYPSLPIVPGQCSRSDPAMNPFHEIRYGQDVVWQIPPRPKAVLFLAHGKDKEPLSFFDPSPNCLQCYGFPEDRAAVLEALHRSYAVIMVKSVEAYWLPYNILDWPPPPSLDRTIVVSVIREWTKEHALEQLPLAAFGYSSGGNFSTLLTLDLAIQSMIVMCSPGEFAVLNNANALSFPPTLFVPMPLDNGPHGFYPKVVNAIDILRSKGVLVNEIDVWPRPIHPHSFSEKIPCLDRATSERIHSAYKSEGWLDDDDYVMKSPYQFDWKGVLWKHKVLPVCRGWNDDDLCFAEHVRQEIMAAWALHSFSSSVNEAIFDWLDDSVMVLGSPRPLTEIVTEIESLLELNGYSI